MANPNSKPQKPALFTPAAPQFMHVAPQVYISSNSVPYAFNQRPSTGFAQLPIYQHIAYPYGTAPTQTQSTVSYNYYPASMMQRATGTIPQAPVSNPNSQNQMPSVPIVTNNHHQQTFPRQQQHKQRSNAIPVIDTDIGADRLQELFEDNSHPPSGESSTRQTPQPSAATQSDNKKVQATFAKQVLRALNKDTTSVDQLLFAPPKDEQVHQVQQQQPQHPQINREVVQTSKLQPQKPASFTPAAAKFIHVSPQVYISSNSVPYVFNQRPSTGFAQLPIYPLIPVYHNRTGPTQTQSTVSYNPNGWTLLRQQQHKGQSNAIPTIDPDTECRPSSRSIPRYVAPALRRRGPKGDNL